MPGSLCDCALANSWTPRAARSWNPTNRQLPLQHRSRTRQRNRVERMIRRPLRRIRPPLPGPRHVKPPLSIRNSLIRPPTAQDRKSNALCPLHRTRPRYTVWATDDPARVRKGYFPRMTSADQDRPTWGEGAFAHAHSRLRGLIGMRSGRPRPAPPSHQRGQALILTALLIIIGFGALLFNSTTLVSNSIANQQAQNVEIELAKVRDALIGWSASRQTVSAPNARPGELPCPDIDNTGTDPGGCSAGAIGRVPWRSLGIPEPKDSAGETLWYAISGPFRYYHPTNNPSPITSDTLGNLTVYQGNSATTLTSQAVAVIFAPGASLLAQNRDSTTPACTTTGTSIARNLCATNYLEATGGGNNAQTGGPFIQAQSSDTFNDRLLVITNADLMPVVEQRVAREMRSLLQGYKAATATSASYPGGVYPWADNFDGDSNDGENRHRFPCDNCEPRKLGLHLVLPGTAVRAANNHSCPAQLAHEWLRIQLRWLVPHHLLRGGAQFSRGRRRQLYMGFLPESHAQC